MHRPATSSNSWRSSWVEKKILFIHVYLSLKLTHRAECFESQVYASRDIENIPGHARLIFNGFMFDFSLQFRRRMSSLWDFLFHFLKRLSGIAKYWVIKHKTCWELIMSALRSVSVEFENIQKFSTIKNIDFKFPSYISCTTALSCQIYKFTNHQKINNSWNHYCEQMNRQQYKNHSENLLYKQSIRL